MPFGTCQIPGFGVVWQVVAKVVKYRHFEGILRGGIWRSKGVTYSVVFDPFWPVLTTFGPLFEGVQRCSVGVVLTGYMGKNSHFWPYLRVGARRG